MFYQWECNLFQKIIYHTYGTTLSRRAKKSCLGEINILESEKKVSERWWRNG